MEVLLLGIYSAIVWLLVRFRILPWNIGTQVTVVIIPIVALTALILFLNVVAPSSADVRVIKYVVNVVPQVRGRVIDVPVEPNRPVKKGDVLFRLDPEPYELQVRALEAQLAGQQAGARELDEQLVGAQGRVAEARAAIVQAEARIRETEPRVELARAGLLARELRFQRAHLELVGLGVQPEQHVALLHRAVRLDRHVDHAAAHLRHDVDHVLDDAHVGARGRHNVQEQDQRGQRDDRDDDDRHLRADVPRQDPEPDEQPDDRRVDAEQQDFHQPFPPSFVSPGVTASRSSRSFARCGGSPPRSRIASSSCLRRSSSWSRISPARAFSPSSSK